MSASLSKGNIFHQIPKQFLSKISGFLTFTSQDLDDWLC